MCRVSVNKPGLNGSDFDALKQVCLPRKAQCIGNVLYFRVLVQLALKSELAFYSLHKLRQFQFTFIFFTKISASSKV